MVTRGNKGKQGVTKEQGVTRLTRGNKGEQGNKLNAGTGELGVTGS